MRTLVRPPTPSSSGTMAKLTSSEMNTRRRTPDLASISVSLRGGWIGEFVGGSAFPNFIFYLKDDLEKT